MTKLLSSYPTAEYTDLSLYSTQKDHNSPANTFMDIHEVDPLAATKIIRRGESSNRHRPVKNKGLANIESIVDKNEYRSRIRTSLGFWK